jgi:alpha-galactosidase
LFTKCGKQNRIQAKSGIYHIRNKNIELEIDTLGRAVIYKNFDKKATRLIKDKTAFTVISDGKEKEIIIKNITLENSALFCGDAELYSIDAQIKDAPDITINIKIYSPASFKDVLISQIEITNGGSKEFPIDTVISHRYLLQAQTGDIKTGQAPFWAYCGGNYEDRYDWIEPMIDGFYRENPMFPTGGNPYTGIWNPKFAIGIMSLAKQPIPLSFPVKREPNSRQLICIKEGIHKQLKPKERWNSNFEAVLVHNGDIYNGLQIWSQLLQSEGLKFQHSPKSCYDPIWCGWGYEDDYTSEELLSTLPIVHEMGIKWVTIDAGWYDRSTFWDLNKKKYPEGDKSMRAFTDSVKAMGMRPKLWYIPATAPYGWPEGRWGKKGTLAVPDKNMLLLDKNGNSVDLKWFGVSLLCPAEKTVIEENKKFIRKAMTKWGFEGFKIDGDYLNQFPSCFNPLHHHKDSLESVYAGEKLYKAMYDEAVSIVPDAVFEICACGSNYSIYNMQAQNQTVASDPLSSWQVRHRGKIYHAFLGSKVAYYGDHVELSDGKNDFASTIGVGGVPGTKFTIIETRKMEEGSKLLTPENKKIWMKYFSAYNKERPAEGTYLNLYDIAYDRPEIHVIKKGKNLYYGIFSPEFKGEITLRGLSPDRSYRIINYIDNDTLANNITAENNKLITEFKRSLLIKAQPVSGK